MRLIKRALAFLAVSATARAEVVRVEIKEQGPWIPGRAFDAGEYELLSGIVYYEVAVRDE